MVYWSKPNLVKQSTLLLCGITVMVIALYALLGTMHVLAASRAQAGDPTQLRINEIMADNNGTLVDPADGDDNEDWIEIYNPTGLPVDLQGLYFTDRRGQLTKHVITQSLVISPFGYLVFWLDEEMEQGPTHLSFKLNALGEAIGLIDADGLTEIDFLLFQEQIRNQSFGRLPNGDGEWQYLPSATPGKENVFAAVINQVRHSPDIPAPFASIAISAVITDNLGIAAATVVYSRTDVNDIQPSTAISIPMTFMGGNAYRAQIPGQASDTLVSYYIVATDNEGNITRFPDRAPEDTRKFWVDYSPPTLAINEIMADNGNSLIDPDEPLDATPANKYPDWFEIYNYGTSTINLRGLFLSDDPDNPDKNEITGTLLLPPRSTIIFYADEDRAQGTRHVNFRLSDAGESIGIYGPFGAAPINVITFGPQAKNKVYGRFPDGQGELTADLCLSPGGPNILCAIKNYLPFISESSLIRISSTEVGKSQ